MADFLGTQAETDIVTLSDEERQPCEIWTRVMGYHRPVSSFNRGKKGEHAERRFFCEDRLARD
ncbi:anaerobic ribonucleoside-triphosphate reductase [Breoghania sp.]|uniref:anaerobic ribonucleoside-triphosphate reductase n=1 Tax=Breoghania sp. TaxID=2065378 RepID=UPI0029CA348E|nr:anaerobic ribonucleoside-triphosphate reductase [Breoghania sp.]